MRLVGNELAWIAAGGIKVNGAVDPEPLRTGETIIADNRLHHLGRLNHSGVGVLIMNAFGNTVAHNEISDLYYTGVSVGWVWGYGPSVSRDNRIEFNHIHHVGQGLLSDLGGVYTLGLSPGTVVRNNIVHDVEGHDKGWGLYTDEGSTGIVLENNLVYRTTHGGFHQHYGRDNHRAEQHLRVRPRRADRPLARRAASLVHLRAQHRLLPHRRALQLRLVGRDRTASRWTTTCTGTPTARRPRFPGGSLEAWQSSRLRQAFSIVADPRFVDPDHDDFRLKPDSPAPKLGFRPLDLSAVGPRTPRAERPEK